MACAARIDVHQHIVPPSWTQALDVTGANPGGWAVPTWSRQSAIMMMDEQGIATGILSVPSPGVHFGDNAAARDLARAVNEYGAEAVKDRPDRFGQFASVPLPDVDAALAEAAYALDTLGSDGVVLMTNAGGRYLGDPEFESLWAELDRRAATVFIHPTRHRCRCFPAPLPRSSTTSSTPPAPR
jgi:predicted TIM-barrel fold metal-dependent hydrolase